jgi:hypothetical protein
MQNTDKCFAKLFSCHRIISGMISEQRLHAQASSAFPKQPGILPLEFNTGFWFRKFSHRISKRQTQTHSSGQECTRFPQAKTANGFSKMNQDIQQRSYRLHAQRFSSEWR